VGGFFPARIVFVIGEGTVEGGTIDILRVQGQVVAHGWRQLAITVNGHA